ncbi:hypothetical protein [Carboxylicivirga sp. N1Y90]|uniref:hypothetical protein n=1 Tax=Carboxylicivirga fragile TaxID=3417571 RepID=UPI003D358862|nr:hypothetical protein [Marinilabiliaceae bacterium N1Y90]
MKKILAFIFVSILLSSSLFSQERMSFKGVSLNNSVEDFVEKLEEKGFKEIGREDGAVMLQGKFLNQNCYVGVIGVANSNTVWRVAAVLPENETWASLRDEYFAVKELYQNKYGKGKSNESFEGYSGNEMIALYEDRCNYHTAFTTKEGVIIIEIEKSNYMRGVVSIIYEDKVNSELNNAEKLDDI